MINTTFTRRSTLAIALSGLLAATLPAIAQTENLRVHTLNPGSSPFTFTTTMQTVLQRELPVQLNVTSGMAATRSTLDAARGEVDLYVSGPSINHFMKNGLAMYKDIEEAPELFKNVRSILNYPLGPYHVLTFADSGIEKLEDIKGKRVFLGPPGGGATNTTLAIVESVTGYKPDVDYELAKLDWSSGNQAFQDRQVDLVLIPTELPSASIQQFALLNEIRLIDIPEEAMEREPLKSILEVPGRLVTSIQPDVYGENQINEEPVRTVGAWVGLGTRVGMDEELVYQITKSIFENIDDFHEAADWMKTITVETAFDTMNAPLHPGALRYYREIGVEIPEDLVPPEAQ